MASDRLLDYPHLKVAHDSKQLSQVLVVESRHIVRECFCTLASISRDIEIVGQASSTAGTVAKAAEPKPDIVVIDNHIRD